jgi:hypothetical protein
MMETDEHALAAISASLPGGVNSNNTLTVQER